MLSDEQLINYCLIEIKKLLHCNGRSLKEFGCLPYPSDCDDLSYDNKFIADELNYDRYEMQTRHDELLEALTSEQRGVYDEIIGAVNNDLGGFFFLYGFGGIGKTFI